MEISLMSIKYLFIALQRGMKIFLTHVFVLIGVGRNE